MHKSDKVEVSLWVIILITHLTAFLTSLPWSKSQVIRLRLSTPLLNVYWKSHFLQLSQSKSVKTETIFIAISL